MSRCFYTFAVIHPSLSPRLTRPGLDNSERDALLRSCLPGNEPLVAFYCTMMDGWNRTHFYLQDAVVKNYPGLARSWPLLDSEGFLCVGHEVTAPTGRLEGGDLERGPGGYGCRRFIAAMHDWQELAQAIRGRAYLSATSLGASFGDDEFTA